MRSFLPRRPVKSLPSWLKIYYNTHQRSALHDRNHFWCFLSHSGKYFSLSRNYISYNATRKRLSCFRCHPEICSPSVSCYGEYSGVWTGLDQRAPAASNNRTSLYNESVISISTSTNSPIHTVTAGKSLCCSFLKTLILLAARS